MIDEKDDQIQLSTKKYSIMIFRPPTQEINYEKDDLLQILTSCVVAEILYDIKEDNTDLLTKITDIIKGDIDSPHIAQLFKQSLPKLGDNPITALES